MATAGDPRKERRAARHRQIVDTAWELARENGLGGVTLHEVARRVGLRQPSLYAYVPDKLGLYDAMFAAAAQALLDDVTLADHPTDPRARLLSVTTAIARFSSADTARQQLLFTPAVPGFVPSPGSFALAERFLAWVVTEVLEPVGAGEPDDVDLYSALVAGLILQQVANDPGGERWLRRIPEVLALFLNREPADGRDG
jgi:AcrR family transcriptional regulator